MNDAPIVCPLCPMHCDDVSAARLIAGDTDCRVATERMQAVLHASASPALSDRDELETGRRWIADADQIVVSGHAIDVETSRAICEFVRATGASVEMAGSNVMALEVMAREGYFTATLGELAARQTSLLVIGDVATHWPRIERWTNRGQPQVRWSDSAALPGLIAAVRRQLSDRFMPAVSTDPDVTAAVELLKAASYLIVLVAPLQECVARTPVIWSSLLGLVRERNKVSRAAILSFDPSITVRSVLAARSDPPPWHYPTNEACLRIELSPFGESEPRSAHRTIVIGMRTKARGAAECILSASVPGLHDAGFVIRGDGSVTLPLQSCIHHKRPTFTPADQLRRLLGTLA